MAVGARVLVARLGSLFLFAVFVSPLLDSNPAWLLGPTANRFAHVIVGEVRFLCCPLRLILLPVGASPPLLWRAGRVLLSFPCLGHVRAALRVVWVGAPRVGAFGWFPFTCGWAVISALRAAREHAPCGGVVAGRGGVDCVCGVGMPRDCTRCGCGCGVSLYSSAVLFAWAACVRLPVCALPCTRLVAARVVARLVSGGVFYYARRGVSARLFVCRLCPALSHVAGLLRFVLFVGYCVVCVS